MKKIFELTAETNPKNFKKGGHVSVNSLEEIWAYYEIEKRLGANAKQCESFQTQIRLEAYKRHISFVHEVVLPGMAIVNKVLSHAKKTGHAC